MEKISDCCYLPNPTNCMRNYLHRIAFDRNIFVRKMLHSNKFVNIYAQLHRNAYLFVLNGNVDALSKTRSSPSRQKHKLNLLLPAQINTLTLAPIHGNAACPNRAQTTEILQSLRNKYAYAQKYFNFIKFYLLVLFSTGPHLNYAFIHLI